MVKNELINKLKTASGYLGNNGKSSEALELENIIKQLQNVNISASELQEIKKSVINKCDIRWLGDIYIKEITNPYEWWNFLGSIKSLAEKL